MLEDREEGERGKEGKTSSAALWEHDFDMLYWDLAARGSVVHSRIHSA